MQLEELKQNMSLLERVLAGTSSHIEINTSACENAQSKILKKYRKAITDCLIVSLVFGCLWMGNVSPDKLPAMYKAFIFIMCGIASVWYMILYSMLKKVNVAELTPVALFSRTTKIKILTLSGEILFGIVLAVFFTLVLSGLHLTPLAFWLIICTIFLGCVRIVFYATPRYVTLFRDLNSIK